jgi:predicted CoA-binding protein
VILSTPAQRRELLRQVKTVAIVGASNNPARPSYFVLRYLKRHGYTVWPVNPAHELVDNEPCFPSLAALARAHGTPDVADVFRRPDALAQVVEEVLAAKIKVIWFQYGVINEAQIERADRAGLTVVVDRCMKVEHARFSRELSSQGFNSGIITVKREAL